MEDRGLNINRKKTVYMMFNEDGNLDVAQISSTLTEFGTSEFFQIPRGDIS